MSTITDYSFSFRLVKNYIVTTFRRYYGEYIVLGKENIPSGCPVIYAPNHINAFMDAIAIHSIAPYELPVIFLARADIFKSKSARKLLQFSKILPAFRMRDGIENLGKNNEVFEQCVDILHQNKALGIMPEGNQGEQRKLRPLVKGIFRIAFAAQQKYDVQPGVKIVPVGLDYGDLAKFGKHIIINVGKPIEISDYMKIHAENPVTAMNDIREKLGSELNDLSLNLATEEYYDCFEIITGMADGAFLKKLDLEDTTVSMFKARQEIAKKLVSIEKNEKPKIEKLNSLSKDFNLTMKKLNLRNWVWEQNSQNKTSFIPKGLKLVVTLPVFLYGLVCNFLPFFIPVYVRKHTIKVEYEGFFSSLQFVLGIITFPLFYSIQTILVYNLSFVPWWAAVLFFFGQYPTGKYAIRWNSETRKYIANRKFRKLTKNKSKDLLHVQQLREQILSLIS